MTAMTIRRSTNIDLLAQATATGDAAQIAAANAMPILQRDEVVVPGTLGAWDFKSPYCNDGSALSTSTTFANLVRGGSPATVPNATGMTQELDGSDPIGINFNDVAARINFPAACKPVAGQGRFGLLIHATIKVRDTTKYNGLVGYTFALTTQNAISLVMPNSLTVLRANVDGGAAVDIPYVLGTPFQFGAEYVPAGAASARRTFYDGAYIGQAVFDNGGSLNQPITAGFTDFMAGQLGSHINTGLEWVLHRVIIEDFATSGRDMEALSYLDWSKRQGRFG
ncbi:hypothetical protein NKJ09_22660 [Mesorhizobium sp. M0189]|uniref:hypothetical protein n=1 Tax=Mesorhizobium sp. M0189 TaxID=2956909 RepID=UPI00333ACE35